MIEMEFPQNITVDPGTRAGRMIGGGGRVVVSVKSKKTGEHISIKFQCCRKNDSGHGKKWPKVTLAEATHVFISVPNGSQAGWDDKVGTFYPRSHKFYEADHADPARVWAACAAARWLNGEAEEEHATYHETNECGRCGRELTDPLSIDRGIGPECFGKATGSQHQVKNRADASVVASNTAFTQGAFLDGEYTGEIVGEGPDEDLHVSPEADEIRSKEEQRSELS